MTAEDLPEGVTITPGLNYMVEDLTIVPPLRAYGNDAAEALAAYAYQRELRARTDSEDRGPVVAEGVKVALPGGEDADAPPEDASDLTPGQDAPPDNPI